MTAAELAARLPGGATRRGSWYDGRCPAHEDTRPSLSFRDEGNRVRILCRAGKGCTVKAIAQALTLRVADLFHDGDRTRSGADAPRRVTTYTYRDEDGELLYELLRYRAGAGGKTFRQRRPDGKGGWIWNLDGTRRVLYRLPELRGQETAYVVEGEKDADNLAGLGLPATTNPGGAGKWCEDFTDQLVAAGVTRVVILPDNDPPGAQHARAVARSCLTAGLTVKLVPLADLPPKGDVSDWRAAGHTREELVEMVKAAPVVTADALAGGDAVRDRTPEAGPVLVRLADVMPEAVRWLWPGRLARGKLTLLIGDPGLGKSFTLCDIAARISAGREWPDGGRAPLGNVLILTAEDGLADTVRPRVDALGGAPGRVWALSAVKQAGGERPFSLAADAPILEKAIRTTGALAVGIDPLSAYLGPADSFKDAEVRGLLAPFVALAERFQVAALAVMHLTKDQQRRAIARGQGSIAFVAAARVVLAVAKDPGDEARRLLVPVKNNLGAPPPALAFSLTSGRLEWEPGPVEGADADALLSTSGSAEERAEARDAEDLLREVLAEGEAAAGAVFQVADAHDVSRRTLNRAKRRLGVRCRHEGQPGLRGGAWYWRLPEAPEGCQRGCEDCHRGADGNLRGSQRGIGRIGADFAEDCHVAGGANLRWQASGRGGLPGVGPVVGVLTLSRALAEGGVVVWKPADRPRLRVAPRWAEPLRREAAEVREVLRRAVAFRVQLDAWARSGRWAVPVLALAEAPPARVGACVSCGASSSPWRCLHCLAAVYVALGAVPPLTDALGAAMGGAA